MTRRSVRPSPEYAAVLAGIEAYRAGDGAKSNPHPDGPLRLAWLRGWKGARYHARYLRRVARARGDYEAWPPKDGKGGHQP